MSYLRMRTFSRAEGKTTVDANKVGAWNNGDFCWVLTPLSSSGLDACDAPTFTGFGPCDVTPLRRLLYLLSSRQQLVQHRGHLRQV